MAVFVLLLFITNPVIASGIGAIMALGTLFPRYSRSGFPDMSTPWILSFVYFLIPILICGSTFSVIVFIIGSVAGFSHGRVDAMNKIRDRYK